MIVNAEWRHTPKAIPPAPYYRAINANTPSQSTPASTSHDVQALSSAPPEPPARSHLLGFPPASDAWSSILRLRTCPSLPGLPAPFQPVIALLIERRNQTGQSEKVCNRRDAARPGCLLRRGYLTPVRFANEHYSPGLRLFASRSIVPATPPAIQVAPTQAATSHFSFAT